MSGGSNTRAQALSWEATYSCVRPLLSGRMKDTVSITPRFRICFTDRYMRSCQSVSNSTSYKGHIGERTRLWLGHCNHPAQSTCYLHAAAHRQRFARSRQHRLGGSYLVRCQFTTLSCTLFDSLPYRCWSQGSGYTFAS